MEFTGMMAIAGVFTGSVLIALFIGEALITWTIRAMDAGVKRAEAARVAAQPQASNLLLACGAAASQQEIAGRTTSSAAEGVTPQNRRR